MKKLMKGELLVELDTWKRLLMREWVEQDEQAFQQIEALLQKPEVTNEWIQGKTVELIEIISKGNIREAMSFIRSLVEEMNA